MRILFQTEIVNDDTESIIVEAAPVYENINEGNFAVPASPAGGAKDEAEAQSALGNGEASVNTVPPLPVVDPNRDSFLDWISAFLKPNQPSSPVLPIGDPPEDCPPCGE